MMALNASTPSPSYDDCDDYDDVKFVPRRLLEGDGAAAIASRYFPAMAKRLRIRDVILGDGDDDGVLRSSASSSSSSSSSSSVVGGKRIRSAAEDEGGGAPMVIIGDMEVVAPLSFVRMRPGGLAGGDDRDDDDDGLWE